MKHEIVPANAQHALDLAPRLREGDLAEIAAGTGKDAEDVLLICIAMSEGAWTWLIDDKPVLIGGISKHPLDPECAVPWALGSNELLEHKRMLLDIFAMFKEYTLSKYPKMENYVDARNSASIKFLTLSGFTLHPAEPHGFAGLPFHRFTLERAACVTSQ